MTLGTETQTEEKKPSLSVVIATYNRKDVLKTTLERLAAQSFPLSDFEVIVVDDGSRDGTADMIRSMKKTMPFKLGYFHQDRRGPGGANNTGARRAKADIIVFLANDMHPTPGVLDAHYRCHMENPEPHIAVVGELRESPELRQTAFQRAWDPFRGRRLDGKKELDEFDMWVSNLSMKRSFFLENGIFLEYPGPAAEDLECSHRLFKNGMKLIYCRDALTYHCHAQTVDTAMARNYATGKNFHIYEDNVTDDRFYRRHRVFSRRLSFGDTISIGFICLLRYLMFNPVTVPYVAIPLIRKGETNRLIRPFMGFLIRRSLGYYFRKGVAESRRSNH